jgi:AcrR family transcriptional regulator
VKAKRRKYVLRRRAATQAETRQRIVEAAVALHETLGPTRTTIQAVAERADVGRPTVYRHFPDERSLFNACSAHYLGRHPPPDPQAWRLIDDPSVRLRTALKRTYAWYRETEAMFTSVFRDLPDVPALNEVMAPLLARQEAIVRDLVAALAATSPRLAGACVRHALALATWRSLAIEEGLSDSEIVELMTTMIASVSGRTIDRTPATLQSASRRK